MNDEELEQMMRAGLRGRASEVEAGGEYAARAHEGARARRHTRVGLVAAATAAVVVASVAVAGQVGQDPGTTQVADPAATSDASPGQTGPSSAVPDDWRVESYDGVQLRVPPDWGWGGVPYGEGGPFPEITTCGSGAFARRGPSGQTLLNEGTELPYVGRQGYGMSDLCMSGLPDPKTPWVWLGSPVEVGTVERGNGYVQKTVEEAGVRVTVGDNDPQELATILASLEAVEVDANGCDSDADPPSNGPVSGAAGRADLGGVGDISHVSVCVYRHQERRTVLGYSTSITRPWAADVVGAITATPPPGGAQCQALRPELDTVILRVHGSAGEADLTVHLGTCSPGYLDGDAYKSLTRANVEPWVVDGVGLYVSGGMVGNALSNLFHPMPG